MRPGPKQTPQASGDQESVERDELEDVPDLPPADGDGDYYDQSLRVDDMLSKAEAEPDDKAGRPDDDG